MDGHYNCVTLSSDDSDENEKIPKQIGTSGTSRKTEHVSETSKEKETLSENNETESKKRMQTVLLETEHDKQDVKKQFNTFLQICCEKSKSDSDMAKVQERLLKAYANANPKYVRSEHFQNILSKKIRAVNSDRQPWLNIKTILDELKSNRLDSTEKNKVKIEDNKQPKPSTSRATEDDNNDEDSNIKDPQTRKHLVKLNNTLKVLKKKIKRLEQKEVNWSDDEDSVYIQLDRYRAHCCKVYKKVCDITGKLPDAERVYLRKVSFSGSSYPEINHVIEKYYNKRREFPDFHDIKKLVEQESARKNINLTPIKIHQVAAAAFKEFGEQLKRLRQYDDYNIMIDYLEDGENSDDSEKNCEDPAIGDPELEEKLKRNAEVGEKRLQNIIDEFANKTKDDVLQGSESESEQHSEEEAEDNHVEKNNSDISINAKEYGHFSEDDRMSENEQIDDNKNSKRKTGDYEYEEEECEDNENICLTKFTSSLHLAPRKVKRLLSDRDGDEPSPPIIKKPKINMMDSDKNEHSSQSDSETNLESDSEVKSEKYEHQMCTSKNDLFDKTDNSSYDIDTTDKNEDIEEVISVDTEKQGLDIHHLRNEALVLNKKKNNILENDENNKNTSLKKHWPVVLRHKNSEKTDSSNIKCITLENSPDRKDSDSDEIDVIVEIPRKRQDKANKELPRRRVETSEICIIHETKPAAQPAPKKGWISKRVQKSDEWMYAGNSGKNSMQQGLPKPLSTHYLPNGSTKFITNTAVQNVIKSGTTKVFTKGVNPSTKSSVKEIIILD